MTASQKPPAIRSHLNIVIDGMSQNELLELGRQLSVLSDVPSISLYKMLPIHENISNARLTLAQATSDLGHIARHKIVHGSNPSILKGIVSHADATILRNQNGQFVLRVNNPYALGVSELMDIIPNVRLQNNAQRETESHCYKKLFSAPVPLVFENESDEENEIGFRESASTLKP